MFFHKKKNDDSVLLRELYEKYCNFLYGVAFGILRNKCYAEDAVHNTVLKISNKLDKIRSLNDNETRNYIATICRNAALDIYNQNKNLIVTKDLALYTPDTNALVVPEDIVVDKESYNDLVCILNTLSSKNYIALKLYRIYDHTIEEIAEIMDISADNAYKRIQRGRKELSEKLEERKCKDNVEI